MRRPTEGMPPRLIEGEGETAELLRKLQRQPRHAPSEAAAWERTLQGLGRDFGQGRLRVGLAAAAGALVGAVVLYAASSRSARVAPAPVPFASRPTPAAAAAPIASTTIAPTTMPSSPLPVTATVAADRPPPLPPTATVAAPSAAGEPVATRAPTVGRERRIGDAARTEVDVPRIQLGRASVGLPAGRAELLGEADVTLSRGGSARAFATPAAATVDLEAGEVELHVEKRPADAGHVFEVVAGNYRFTVLGTAFRVTKANGDVTLSVTEGRVAVSQGTTRLGIVTGGGFWAGSTRPPPPSPRAGTVAMTSASVRERADRPTADEADDAPKGPTLAPEPFAPGSGSTRALAREPLVAVRSGAAAMATVPVAASSRPRPTPATAFTSVPATAPTVASTLAQPRARPAAPLLPLGDSPGVASPPPSTRGRCMTRATTTPQTARATIDCLLGEAQGADLGAQVALYEAARLYRDALGDARRAVAALREMRRRFPSSPLRAEVDLSLAELLPALGSYREALDESAALLDAGPPRERADEIHLMRGDLLRTGVHDCRAAAAEYAEAADGARDGVSDPASFFRAVCLQKVGDTAEAREAFLHYLARPQPRHAAEATRRLRDLGRDGP